MSPSTDDEGALEGSVAAGTGALAEGGKATVFAKLVVDITFTALTTSLLGCWTDGGGCCGADVEAALSFSCSRIAFRTLALSFPVRAGPAFPTIIPLNAADRSDIMILLMDCVL
jgi:hypothetical protein